MKTDALIAKARSYVRETPSDGIRRNIAIRAKNAGNLEDNITLGCWTFLTQEPGTSNDYEAMLPHWKAMVDKFNPDCAWFVTRQPSGNMFHRAMSMCAHVHSSLFTRPTVFLDVDAFPNADLLKAMEGVRDVGLTVRNVDGLMPVNEGVIFARPTEATKAFFMAYVATYEALQELLTPDDWGWWGGQLALNALMPHDSAVLLPCETHNFSPDTASDFAPVELDTKAVIHLKGPRKAQFERVKAYQDAR